MSRVKRIADLINILMVSLCIAVCVMTLIDTMNAADVSGYIVLLLGIFIIMAAAHLLRVLARKIIWYFMGHIVLVAVALWILYDDRLSFNIYMAGAWFLLSFVIVLVDIAFWTNAVNAERNLPVQENGEPVKGFKPVFKEGLPYISVYFTIVFVLVIFVAVYQGYDRLMKSVYISGIAYMTLFLIRMYLNNISYIVETAELGNNVTQKRLLRANSKLVIPFILFTVFAMVLFRPEVTAEMINKFLGILIKGIAYVIAIILFLFSAGSADELEEESEIAQEMDLAYGENPAWVDMLFKILDYLLAIGLIALVIFLIAKLIIRLIKFYNSRSTNELKQHQYGDMTEVSEHINVSVERSKREKRIPYRKMDNRERIRYLYKKFVMKAKGDGYEIRLNHTPDERRKDYVRSYLNCTDEGMKSDNYNRSSNEDKMATRVTALTSIYNRARYFNDEIYDEDVTSVRR